MPYIVATMIPGLQEKLRICMMAVMGRTEQDVLAGVGPRLRALRRARGATLADLAAETGITSSTLSRLETGKLRPTLEQLLPVGPGARRPARGPGRGAAHR